MISACCAHAVVHLQPQPGRPRPCARAGALCARALVQSIQQLLAGMEHMMALVEAAAFNIFDKGQAERWRYACAEFDNTNAALIAATGNLIDITFRSANPKVALHTPVMLLRPLTCSAHASTLLLWRPRDCAGQCS